MTLIPLWLLLTAPPIQSPGRRSSRAFHRSMTMAKRAKRAAKTQNTHWSVAIESFMPCPDGRAFARSMPSLKAAWAQCPRGNWMLWLAAKCAKPNSPAHRRVVLAACACARLSLKHVPEGEVRPLEAIEIAERWARRKPGATLQVVMKAAKAANAATYAAAAAYAAKAADYAAYAGYAAKLAEYTVIANARPAMQLATAKAVRRIIKTPPKLGACQS